MCRLSTEPVVYFKGKWVQFETMPLDPKPIQKPERLDQRLPEIASLVKKPA